MIALLLSLLTGGGLDRFLPCTPGLSVEYRDGAGALATETVIGFVVTQEPRVCAVRREAGGRVETWGREYLEDRISNAGWIDRPLAARAPILRAPLAEGARWRFNREETRVLALGRPIEVPAGRFEDTVWLVSQAVDGDARSESVYAAGVGLVRYTRGATRLEAVRVRRRPQGG